MFLHLLLRTKFLLTLHLEMEESVKHIKISEFNYPLPDERIAKFPLAERDSSKLLVYRQGAFYSIGKIPGYTLHAVLRQYKDIP